MPERMIGVESGRLALWAEAADRFRTRDNLTVPAADRFTLSHLGNLDRFIFETAATAVPLVMADWWIHTEDAVNLGGLAAEALIAKGVADIYPLAIRAALRLHDAGRLINPPNYLREALLGERLAERLGMGCLNSQLQSLRGLLQYAEGMNISIDDAGQGQNQVRAFLNGEDPEHIFTDEQKARAEAYFESLSPAQRVTVVADNLGKRDKDNRLFSYQAFVDYLRSQELRYDKTSRWPQVNWSVLPRQRAALLQAYGVKHSLEWMKQAGIDWESIVGKAEPLGARLLVLARHGDVESELVYTRDAYMAAEHIPHLTELGRDHVRRLGQLLRTRGIANKLEFMAMSPEARARETAEILQNELRISDVREPDLALDDVDAQGPYRERLLLSSWRKDGNPYDGARWANYSHETMRALVRRIDEAVVSYLGQVSPGRIGVLVSHSDPLVLWSHAQFHNGKLPDYPDRDLRGQLDPAGAMLSVYAADGQLKALYQLAQE